MSIPVARVCELHRNLRLPLGPPESFSSVEPRGYNSARDLVLEKKIVNYQDANGKMAEYHMFVNPEPR